VQQNHWFCLKTAVQIKFKKYPLKKSIKINLTAAFLVAREVSNHLNPNTSSCCW
jgi:hypothetical protein